MTGIIQSLLMGYGAAAVATDADFEYVTLLLPGNGTNGAQNNTFLDSSTNNFTITRNGNTTQGTFTPYGSNWSNYFDGTGDYLTGPTNNAAFQFGTGDFTVEMWVNTSNLSNYQTLLDARSGDTQSAWCLFIDNTGKPYWYDASGVQLSSTAITANTWTHLAVARSGSTLKMFLAGSEVYSGTNSNSQNASGTFYVGRNAVNAFLYTGYISNLRIVKGTAVYTAAFTPPTAPLTAITNTSLLTCQSNRFIDNSTNAFTITRNGDVSVQRFSPFSPAAAYASGTIGGSGYFDGTGDYLDAGTNAALGFGTGDFTVEAWIYRNASGNFPIYTNGPTSSGSWAFYVVSDKLEVGYYGGTSLTGATTLTTNAWNHVAVVRSGSTLSLYLNGSRDATTTTTSNNTTSNGMVGRDWTNASTYSNGYISNLRVVKGSAVYSGTTYTVPTAPLTAITNTSLLLNFTNAGIIDNAMMNDLETVGNAQISTTQSKFGGSSINFGSGNYLAALSTPNVRFGSGNFTIEGWVYFSTLSASQVIVSLGYTSSETVRSYLVYVDTSNQLHFAYSTNGSTNTDTILGTPGFSTGVWYHIAVVRNGSTVTGYVNGTALGTTVNISTNSLFESTSPLYIGNDASGSALLGFIDDLRITKGVARYTANFTAPTAAFPTS